MYFSTRDSHLRLSASEAILRGLSAEGGLFLPEEIKAVDVLSLRGKSYPEIAARILTPYLDDFTPSEIASACEKAYGKGNFPEQVINVRSVGEASLLELFHGPTLTFKDMALSLLAPLMELALAKHPEAGKLRILSATSGDTGSAVLAAFHSVPSIDVSILYPDGGVAPLQEKQMLSFTSASGKAYALKNSNFDTCQSLIKKWMVSRPYGQAFTSANSINIGRLLPQIVYYYAAYLALLEQKKIQPGERVDVVVPTGNFGDIFAAYLAKKMSLPLGKLVVASNANRILTDFFLTGVYDIHRSFLKTNSPSMDILLSSNLERLLYWTCLDDRQVAAWESSLAKEGRFAVDSAMLGKLQADFAAISLTEEETKQTIHDCFASQHYLLDPHSAVAYGAARQYSLHSKAPLLVVATASPYKFPETVWEALGFAGKSEEEELRELSALSGVPLPPQLQRTLACKTPAEALDETSFLKKLSPSLSYLVKAPASSANLGPGFDVCGIALSLWNSFAFAKANEDGLIGFEGEEETKDNLVLKSYRAFFREFGLPYQPVSITLLQADVPLSRGLGSSATCIVAGLEGANAICHHLLDEKDLLDLAAKLEGHPDNVAPCLYGGFVTSYRDGEGHYHPRAYPLSPRVGFLLVVPPEELSTSLARSVLPKSYPLSDITFDASRLIQLPSALEAGDLPLLKDLLSDRLHVPYRSPLIPEAAAVKTVAEAFGLPWTISGAGSSLLVLYDKDNLTQFDSLLSALQKRLPKASFLPLSVSKKGASVKEMGL